RKVMAARASRRWTNPAMWAEVATNHLDIRPQTGRPPNPEPLTRHGCLSNLLVRSNFRNSHSPTPRQPLDGLESGASSLGDDHNAPAGQSQDLPIEVESGLGRKCVSKANVLSCPLGGVRLPQGSS